jgi:hypothetical protein
LLVISASWIVGGGIYALAKDRRLTFTREKARYAALSGTLVFLIVYFLMRAVEQGEASVVIPIANMSFVVALAISLATTTATVPTMTCRNARSTPLARPMIQTGTARRSRWMDVSATGPARRNS